MNLWYSIERVQQQRNQQLWDTYKYFHCLGRTPDEIGRGGNEQCSKVLPLYSVGLWSQISSLSPQPRISHSLSFTTVVSFSALPPSPPPKIQISFKDKFEIYQLRPSLCKMSEEFQKIIVRIGLQEGDYTPLVKSRTYAGGEGKWSPHDHHHFTVPFAGSEIGCNLSKFGEVEAKWRAELLSDSGANNAELPGGSSCHLKEMIWICHMGAIQGNR